MSTADFALQRYLPPRMRFLAAFWRKQSTGARRRVGFASGYAVVACLGGILLMAGGSAAASAFGMGLVFPGAGFLVLPFYGEASLIGLPLLAAFGSMVLFAIALLFWVAAGNVIAPPLAWLGSAFCASALAPDIHSSLPAIVALVPAVSAAIIFGAALFQTSKVGARSNPAATISCPGAASPDRDSELSKTDLQLARLLLDRALQPIDSFNGFDHLDPFQTAALRYQINFISYALAIAQAEHLPSFDGYWLDAQKRLAQKIQLHCVWSYWRLENLWGNLSAQADPISRDNIMFSGFLAAQINLAQNANEGSTLLGDTGLRFALPSGSAFEYSQAELLDAIETGYRESAYGLQACEPNWIYPLCNLITAVGLKAGDHAFGKDRWARVQSRFMRALERDFIRTDGSFVVVRSGLTGFAPPAIGGAAMQTLPCLFLNALIPEMAQLQWANARRAMANRGLRKAFWPVDTGNYRLSRAAGFASGAAAAVELGDSSTANRLLQHLEEDHPAVLTGGAMHRPNVSVWAHALEFIARSGSSNTLARLVAGRPSRTGGLRLTEAPYLKVNVAMARPHGAGIRVVLYPNETPVDASLGFTGLAPDSRCRLQIDGVPPRELAGDPEGKVSFNLPVRNRIALSLCPVES